MWGNFWRVAGLAAALFAPATVWAQDITLSAREGGLSISGSLQGFDGEVYRINSVYGPLTIDASGVICDGPACPDLTAPRAQIRIIGLAGVGEALLPDLFRAFAQTRGLGYTLAAGQGYAATLSDPVTDKPLADISFVPADPDVARTTLVNGAAELILSAEAEPGLGARILAMDAMVPITAPDNPIAEISTRDLARVLSGEVDNWAAVGGPDMPLVVHGLAPASALQRALAARLGRNVAATMLHADTTALAKAVAADPWAIAMTVRAGQPAARALPLTDSCGFPLLPSRLAVKAEDYPLALPLFLITPNRRLPLMIREFLDFLALPQAQAAIAAAGWIDRQPERQPMTADGLRLMNAIQGAGEETSLGDLKRLVAVMDGAERLSLTFRFTQGSNELDSHSRENLADLLRLIEIDAFAGLTLLLAGFSDGSGTAKTNLALSQARADGILGAMRALAPQLPEAALPQVMAFGEVMPMACDETSAGRRLNRRVEVWLRPGTTNSPPPEN